MRQEKTRPPFLLYQLRRRNTHSMGSVVAAWYRRDPYQARCGQWAHFWPGFITWCLWTVRPTQTASLN